jgi:LAO/AO transport system kinase
LGQGVDTFWAEVTQFKHIQTDNGKLHARRQQQALAWMWERIDAGLKQRFRAHPQVRDQLEHMSAEVAAGRLPASTAARQLLAATELPPNPGGASA